MNIIVNSLWEILMKSKSLFYIAILLVVLLGIGTVSASENVTDVDMTLGDSNSGSPVYVDNWASLESYCESTNDDYTICLNGSFSIGSQIEIKNNVNIIGDANYFIGGTADNVDTYSSVPFLCSDELNVTFTNVNFQYTGGKNLMQFSGNGNYKLENCNFDNLNSGTDNSIIWSNYGVINVNNCSFSDCTVKTGVINNYYAANAATFNNARLYVVDSRFINNNAPAENSHSGAIANGGYLVVENSIFDSNYAFRWAGAIHTAAYANTTIYNSNFTNNLADWNGGALYTYSNLQIYNCNFIDNNCTTNNGGGAIGACKVLTEPNVYVFNSTFKRNINKCSQLDDLSTTGLGRGGAISIMDDGTLKVYNNTFVENDAVIGSAICAISQGSYGSPDVEIVGNEFINHTGLRGSDVIVTSLSNSNYIVENNTYENNKISVGMFRLDVDENNGDVTANVTLRLKHPEYYDSDIITKSGFAVYVDNNRTNPYVFHDTTFSITGVNQNIEVVPLFLNASKSKNINDPKYNTIYVSTSGNDLNNGTSRNYAVRTISKAIELARNDVKYIKILEGTYYERNIVISYEKTIEGEGNVILMGDSSSVNTFNIDASCEFNNLQFTGITGGMAINVEDNTLINITNCLFYSNNIVGKLINAKNLNIEDSSLNDNTINYLIYSSGNLNMMNCIIEDNIRYSNSARIIQTTGGSIFNSSFVNNEGYNGIIYLNGDKSSDIFEISQSKFLNNNVKYRGGAIYGNSMNKVIIDSSIFYNNHATNWGGAIYLTNNVLNLNITNSILINNNALATRNYQIDRVNNPTSNIYAINNWWGNTIDNSDTAPTFQSRNNVNASIWLILNVTSNVTSLSSGESALVTFDLTYTNILGSDAPNGTDITGNLTPFCIDGVDLPILEGVLTATNGNVNIIDVSLVDGKASVVFTATGTNPYLTIDILGISESIYFDNVRLLHLNDLNDMGISDSINMSTYSSKKSTKGDLLSLSFDDVLKNDDDWKYFYIELCQYTNGLLIIPDFDAEGLGILEYLDNLPFDIMDFIQENYEGDSNFHINISFFNSSSNSWEILVSDSFHMPFPGYFRGLQGLLPPSAHEYFLSFSRGVYNISCVYDGQELVWEMDDGEGPYEMSFEYNPDSWSFTFDTSEVSYNPTLSLSDVVFYEGSSANVNPNVNMDYTPVGRDPSASELAELNFDDGINWFNCGITNSPFSTTSRVGTIMMQPTNELLEISDINPDDFPVVKPVNITMTITQGDKVIGNPFSVAPGSTYSLEGLAAGEYNLTAVYDDPFYGYATKTVTISVYGNHIWETGGADMGYSHQTDYYGPKNVKELWNMSINNFQGPVIDFEGNIYIASGRDILVLDNDGNVIRTIGNVLNNPSKGLLLWKDLIFSSVFSSWSDEAIFYRINDIMSDRNYNLFPLDNEYTSRSWYAPVYSNDKIYFVIPEFDYGLNDYNNVHLLVYNADEYIGYQLDNRPGYGTITKSSTFAKAMEAPSIDSEGYIYVNTKSGLVILDPELNILDLSFGDAGKYGRPVIDSLDMVYVFNSDRTKVYALNRETGLEWNTTIADGACGVMAVDVENNALYIVGNDGILYKLNRANGEMSEFYSLGTNASSILVDARGTIYLGGTDGVLYAVTNEGKTLFKYNIGGTITKDMVLDDNGTLYVYADTKLYALGGAPKLFSEIIINVSDVEVNRNSTIVATLPEDAQGNVTFIIDDVIESGNIEIIGGNATWTAPGLLSGNHTVKVTWVGDSEYFGSEATKEFNAYKVNSTIDLEDSVNYAGKLTQLNITLPEDAVGNVTVTFNRKTETVKIVNGTATFETTSLEAGNYAIDFSWDGDERYFGNSGYAYFTVIKNDASLTIDAEPIKEGEDLKVTVTLSDDESGMVLIMVGDVKDFAEIKDGKAEFTISGLTADTYNINATYLGDNKYYNTTETSQVTVSAKDTATIEISPEVITEDDKQSIEITLPDDATGNVLVEVNGNTFYAEVNGGKVNVPVSGLKANTTYPVTVTYSGNDIYSETTGEGEVTTPEEPVVEPLDPGLELSVQDTVITVSVNDNATGLVIITVGDISFVMDAHELEPIDVSDYLTNGTYDVEVIYLGDEVFMNATDSDKVTVPEEPIIEPLDPELYVDIQNTTITVSINKDATGLVIITVGDISFVFDAGELEPVDVSEFLTNGTYPVSVEYLGDDVFDEALFIGGNVTVPSEPVVEPKDAGLNVDIKDTIIAVFINKDATGLVIITVGDISFVFDASELEPVDVSEYLTNGTYPVSVEYLGDDIFANATQSGSVTVPSEPVVEPKDPELKATAKETAISVSVNKDATGYVVVDVDGTSYYAEIENGQAVIDVKGLEAGENYTASVTYMGDGIFSEAETTVEISIPDEPVVEPKDPNLKASVENTTVSVSVDKDATGYVVVDVDGTSYYAEIENGKAVISIPALRPGSYSADVTYAGDENYKNASTTVSITVPDEPVVEPKDPNLKAAAVNNTITATVDKDATGSIMVDVDGQGYYAPIKDGKAVINVIGLDEGKYNAVVSYVGDDTFKAANAAVSITVPKKEDPQPEPVDPKADIRVSNETVSVDLPKDATGYLLVDVDGKGYYAPVKDGKATLDLPELAPGNHTVTVTYTGDKKYDSANATQTITVEEDIHTVVAENLTKVEKAPDRFEALFTDAKGNPLANTDVTFELNGQKYTRTTDANGKAGIAINLIAGNYTIVTTNPVTKESVTNTITVLPRLEGSDLTKYFRNASQYRVKVYDDNGNPVKAGEIVTFNINGVFYNRTTGNDGFVQLSINLNPGDYIITTQYKGCQIANNIKVLPILSAKDLTKKYGVPGAFETKLVDGQGKAYANQAITFNINGVLYTRNTNSDGIAKLNINLMPGQYIITSVYGNAAISNTVTVTA